jgi:Zn-dependent peptidase ImmA (M78 family)
METGDRRITVTDLSAVASALGLSLVYFLPTSSASPADFQYNFRAEDVRNINPGARRIVIDFLLFSQKNGSECSAPPDGVRRKRPAAAAEAILALAKVQQPPVGPRDVARRLGIPVFDWPFSDEISAMFVCFEGKTAIGVNETHPVVRQRFSIAHEIGHYVYADRDAIVLDFFGRERGFSFESSESFESETKANQFAADLLMPASWVKKDVGGAQPDLRLLAKTYGVSEQAMWFRLVNLHIVAGSDRPI